MPKKSPSFETPKILFLGKHIFGMVTPKIRLQFPPPLRDLDTSEPTPPPPFRNVIGGKMGQSVSPKTHQKWHTIAPPFIYGMGCLPTKAKFISGALRVESSKVLWSFWAVWGFWGTFWVNALRSVMWYPWQWFVGSGSTAVGEKDLFQWKL